MTGVKSEIVLSSIISIFDFLELVVPQAVYDSMNTIPGKGGTA
jgi:hypothetical protein